MGEVMSNEECLNRLRSLLPLGRPRPDLLPGDEEAIAWAVAEIERLQAERDEARAGYHALDANWAAVHEGAMGPIREALKMSDGAVPELVERIAEMRRVGSQMANLCFNLSQPDWPFEERDRDGMRELYRAWDAALRG